MEGTLVFFNLFLERKKRTRNKDLFFVFLVFLVFEFFDEFINEECYKF
jgi:hypothetical protein